MFATYNLAPAIAPPTKLIATIDRHGRIFAIRGNTEQTPNFGLEGATEREFPLDTKVEPGQMIDTITIAV